MGGSAVPLFAPYFFSYGPFAAAPFMLAHAAWLYHDSPFLTFSYVNRSFLFLVPPLWPFAAVGGRP